MLKRLQSQMEQIFLGKTLTVQLCLTAFLAGEHLLLEDVPGVGKTLLARTLARSVDAKFRRIQFTPDLLPAEITGSVMPSPASGSAVSSSSGTSASSSSGTSAGFGTENASAGTASGNVSAAAGGWETPFLPWRFMPGPVFANIVLADEINRATPRTQSALLEAMGEGSVTTDGETRPLPVPFFVIATQNPVEFEGTFPLPESQLDRFLMRISIGYAPREQEKQMLAQGANPEAGLTPVLSLADVRTLQESVRNVTVAETLKDYMMDIVLQTRQDPACRVGVSTRGLLAFFRAAQAWALVQGRDYVVPDDVKFLAVPVLAHRIVLKSTLKRDARKNSEDFLKKILERIPTP